MPTAGYRSRASPRSGSAARSWTSCGAWIGRFARFVPGRARSTTCAAQLSGVLSRTPRPEEIAAALGLRVADLNALDADLARAGVVSLHALGPAWGSDRVVETGDGPELQLLRREQLDELYSAINELPDRLRIVVTGYFFEERKMADIAAELGVTESRISQMRAEAVRLLRDLLGRSATSKTSSRSRGSREQSDLEFDLQRAQVFGRPTDLIHRRTTDGSAAHLSGLNESWRNHNESGHQHQRVGSQRLQQPEQQPEHDERRDREALERSAHQQGVRRRGRPVDQPGLDLADQRPHPGGHQRPGRDRRLRDRRRRPRHRAADPAAHADAGRSGW